MGEDGQNADHCLMHDEHHFLYISLKMSVIECPKSFKKKKTEEKQSKALLAWLSG